ncbi:unnamed protein product [Peniophora sp. CBMAI 1063]|nr:unnamed protein product [Peniophora sp. CBMAI 1063]
MTDCNERRPVKRVRVNGSYPSADLSDNADSVYASVPPNFASRNAMSVLDVVLVIISHVKDSSGLYDVLLSQNITSSEEERARALAAVQSMLDLRLVNRAWSEAILLSRSSWATVPATLTCQTSSLKRAIRLSGRAALTLTFEKLPDSEVWDLLGAEQDRLNSLKLSCFYPADFYTQMNSSNVINHRPAMSALKALEVCAARAREPLADWIELPTPRLNTLRLRNFPLKASCVLPQALRDLNLQFDDMRYLYEIAPEYQISLSDLLGVLAGLPSLERLKLDIRYMLEQGSSNGCRANFAHLKQLSVRSFGPRSWNTLVSRISCPPLNRAHLILDLQSADVGEVADDLTTASAKLSGLLVGSSEEGGGFAHVYIDERGAPIAEDPIRRHCQTTVAAAVQGRAIPLTDDSLSATSIARNTAFGLTVVREAHDKRHRDSSPTLRFILAGLPPSDIDSLTVYCRPERALQPEAGEEAGSANSHDNVALAYADNSVFDPLTSARRVNWLGSGRQLAKLLRREGMFPDLSYLPHEIPSNAEYNLRLEHAVEYRKRKAWKAIRLPKECTGAESRSLKKAAWRAPLLLPEMVANIAKMFDTLLETIGERVV